MIQAPLYPAIRSRLKKPSKRKGQIMDPEEEVRVKKVKQERKVGTRRSSRLIDKSRISSLTEAPGEASCKDIRNKNDEGGEEGGGSSLLIGSHEDDGICKEVILQRGTRSGPHQRINTGGVGGSRAQ